MAQSTGRGVVGWATALAGCTAVRLSGLSYFALAEAKEDQAIPACAGGGPRDRTQRTVSLTLVMKPVFQHLDFDGLAAKRPAQDGTGPRSPWVWLDRFAFCRTAPQMHYAGGNVHSQIPIVCDLQSPAVSTFRQIAFRQCLQPPGDPPNEVLFVRRGGALAENFLVPLAQFRDLHAP